MNGNDDQGRGSFDEAPDIDALRGRCELLSRTRDEKKQHLMVRSWIIVLPLVVATGAAFALTMTGIISNISDGLRFNHPRSLLAFFLMFFSGGVVYGLCRTLEVFPGSRLAKMVLLIPGPAAVLIAGFSMFALFESGVLVVDKQDSFTASVTSYLTLVIIHAGFLVLSLSAVVARRGRNRERTTRFAGFAVRSGRITLVVFFILIAWSVARTTLIGVMCWILPWRFLLLFLAGGAGLFLTAFLPALAFSGFTGRFAFRGWSKKVDRELTRMQQVINDQ